jgi:hypothetical protein
VSVVKGITNKAMREVAQKAIEQGWTFRSNGKHIVFYAPDGAGMCVVGSSAHGARAVDNLKAEFRKRGLQL